MNKEQVKGYLLEAVVEKLIRINGYEVITKANNDDIIQRGNGLNVKGRGGYHQFDSLGNFKIIPPFMYPLRLFAEAKFYSEKHKVGIDLVRMGIGLLQDVNTNYSTVLVKKDELTRQRYDYHYAIFSASGFTSGAQKLALAHKICLIDFSYTNLKDIKDLIEKIVDKWIDEEQKNKGSISEKNEDLQKSKIDEALKRFREHKTFCYEDRPLAKIAMLGIEHDFTKLNEAVDDKSLYFASTIGAKDLALIPDSDKNIREAFEEEHHHKVSIKWDNDAGFWIITPKDCENKYEFTFSLPNLFASDWLNSLEKEDKNESVMSFIAYFDYKNPTLCTLTFDRKEMISCILEAEEISHKESGEDDVL